MGIPGQTMQRQLDRDIRRVARGHGHTIYDCRDAVKKAVGYNQRDLDLVLRECQSNSIQPGEVNTIFQKCGHDKRKFMDIMCHYRGMLNKSAIEATFQHVGCQYPKFATALKNMQ